MPSEISDLERTEDRQILARLPFLRKLSDTTQERVRVLLDDISEKTTVAEGETLLQEGSLVFASGYILLKGTIQIEREGLALIELDAPIVLGEISRFSQDDLRTATVRATSNGRLLRFSWDDLYEHAEKELSEENNKAFLRAIERVVWERQDLHDIPRLAIFSDLDEELKVRACFPLPWISKRMILSSGDALFDAGARCRSQGFLLTKGSVELTWGREEMRVVSSPNIIGIMPNNKPERLWSASARAGDEADLLAFSWLDYGEALRELLSREDMKRLFESMKNNAKRHFWH